MELSETVSALEGILFAAGEPVEAQRLCKLLGVDRVTLDGYAKQLADGYRFEKRGIRLLDLDGAYQLCSAQEHGEVIRRALETRKPPQLSQTALEVLAIFAYFQPTTRGFVEQVRGVDSSYTINQLLERGLIEEAGKLSAPGRPTLFRTTRQFLRCFALDSLEDLPALPESGEDAKLTQELEEAAAMLQAVRDGEGGQS
jgi:segregation and condensation protein B